MLLRGFSWQSSRHPKRKPPVDLALKIYHSMSANNCPVKPNIIHTNAVLHICALAGDMDALWGVAAKLPQRGPGTPTNFTFTTILDAIRMSAWQSGNDLADQNVDETGMRRQESVIQGRRIWEEVISRWRAGELWIDEKLACSMGRLLLLGTVTQDFQDVLSLAEQVMGIPKRNAGWIEPSDTTRQPPAASYPVSQEIQPTDPTTSLTEPAHVSLDPPPSPSPPPTDLVRVFHSNPSKDPSNLTAQPGPNTLSLLLAAGINLRQPHNAQYYWNLLTSPTGPYKVAPDNENYHMYLRLLRLQHNSRLALQVVQDLVSQANDAPRKANAEDGAVMEGKKQGAVAAKTFRIALSCCVRDKNNPEAINHATELVRMMQETLTAPDIRSLGMYLDLGISQKKKDWRAVWHVCRHMRAPMELVKNGLNYGVQGAQGVSGLGTGWDMEEVRNLWKSYAGAVDSVLDLGREDLYNDSKKRKQVVGLMKWAQLMVVRWGKNRVRRKQGRGEEPGQLETEEQGLVEEGELEQADEKETERMRKVMGGWKKRMAAAGKAVRRRFEPEELKGFAEQ
ncbi:MAG: hypothetical protein LQ342_003538 [Letrouitia transgressa]|nr:MAG: hypothetical protein LQ342_003538 [Letrouitia transgressa]